MIIFRKSWLCDAEISERCDKKRVMLKFCLQQNFPGFFIFNLIRRSLEFFTNAKNRGDSSFLDDEAKTVAHHGLKRSLRGFRYAQPLKMTMIICFVLSLGVVSESRAACNGATATTAGTDEDGAYCGSWDCGAAGSNVTCTLSKGTLTISGEGEMKDYGAGAGYSGSYPSYWKSYAPWAGKYVTKAVIEGNITRIGNFTFAGEKYLTEISGTENLQSIGASAFNRTSLSSVDIPNVTHLGAGAFHMASSLQYVNMRDDVVLLNNDWFSGSAGTFAAVGVVKNSCVSNPETGMKTCGSCGDKYVKAGTGCVTAENCGDGYYLKESTKQCLYCPYGKVVYKNQCLDEYPFAKKHYTPAEAAQWLNEDNNTVTLTFKK